MTDETLPTEPTESLPEETLPPVEETPAPDTVQTAASPKADPEIETAAPAETMATTSDSDAPGVPEEKRPEYVRFNLKRGANPNVLNVSPVFRDKPADSKEAEDDPYHISALPCDVSTFQSLIEAYPPHDFELGNLSRQWSYEVQQGAALLQYGDFFTRSLARPDSKWAQRAPYGAATLGPMRSVPDAKSGGPGMKLSGDSAVGRIAYHLGFGSSTTIPLWHSGFWVTLRSPTLEARLELQRRLDFAKVDLGRATGGLAFSNVSVYVKSYLADFALAHLVTTNVRYTNIQDLKDLILSTDIPALIWGMLTTQYPSGYAYHQPCVNDPSKCQHVVREIIDLNKIFFVDTASLTESQLRHMADRKRYEPADLKTYQDQHRYTRLGVFDVTGPSGSIKVELKVPSITEYISAGVAWVDGIINDMERGFQSDLQGNRRKEYILERSRVTNLCEYSHWVNKIVLPGGEEIDDVETIRKTLATISGEPAFSTVFFEKVKEYIEETTIALVALPKFDCPVCGASPTVEEKHHPYLNPIDVETLFFTLGAQRIVKAMQ